MRSKLFIQQGIAFGLAALVCGCALGPTRPDLAAQAVRDAEQVPAWSPQPEAVPSAYLDDLIRSPELDALVKEALAANPSLQQTLTTLRITRAQRRQTGAARLPSVEGSASGSREQFGDPAYGSSVTVSWEVDLWGKLSEDYQAAEKDVEEQQALYRSARDALAADLMENWLGLIADRHAIEIEQRRLATLEQNADFILQRYRSGLGRLEDLDSARSSAASSRASLARYRESLAQRQRALRVLLGRVGGTETIDFPADYPQVLPPLAALPDQTLQRRPDLQAAYAAIQAADLRTSVAYKDLLPSISLQAALSDAAAKPSATLLQDPLWSLLGQLTAPLYRGGQLRAAAEIAKLQTAQAYQAYRETLLTAVQEVEDALGQERTLAERQTHVKAALTAARNNLAQYERSYRAGLVDILDLLSVQKQTYDLEAQLDNLRYERLANRVVLGLALGLGTRA
ncbi:efflux transporter outer membrane subunit [Thiorhodococcus fuscus]|uniref:Efflux transporter outer membrane subunit n=1 Tax=Thiorhodococcus fuscus TaxID=527200 RepID=A0ABW4YCN3_9GAMM